MVKITDVKVLDGYQLNVTFNDGISGNVDLSYLLSKEVFRIWSDYAIFKSVHIDEESGALTWNDNIDIDTYNLYCKIAKINPEYSGNAKN